MHTEENRITEEKIVNDILESGFVIVDVNKIIEEHAQCKEWIEDSLPSINFIAEYYCLVNNLLEFVDLQHDNYNKENERYTGVKCTTRVPITIIEAYNTFEGTRTIFNKGEPFYVSVWNEEQNKILKNFLEENDYIKRRL